jgi:pimeloyl-ACP methyl ester carboxylesterase
MSEQMLRSAEYLEGQWRYERIDSATHFMMLDQPDRINQLILEFLATA